MACSFTLEDWFYHHPTEFHANPDTTTCWPYINVNISNFVDMLINTPNSAIFYKFNWLLLFALAPVAFLGSCCSVAALWRKATKEQDENEKRFYRWMILIAIFDFLYFGFFLPIALSENVLFENPYDYRGALAICYLNGFVYISSSAADVCMLALTLERFFAICKPLSTILRNTCLKGLGVLASIFVILIRGVRYSFTSAPIVFNDANASESIGYVIVESDFSKSEFFKIQMHIGDIVLPFLFLFLVSYLSLRIAIVIIKKRRKQIQDASFGGSQNQIEANQRMSAMLRLLTVLVILTVLVTLFILKQLGLCLYAIGFLLNNWAVSNLSVESTLAELISCNDALLYNVIIISVCVALQVLSPALNFYLYLCFSSAIRTEFMRLFLRCKPATTVTSVSISNPRSNAAPTGLPRAG